MTLILPSVARPAKGRCHWIIGDPETRSNVLMNRQQDGMHVHHDTTWAVFLTKANRWVSTMENHTNFMPSAARY